MSINQFTVSGNVGKDAELKVTQNGKHVAQFSLPCKLGYGDYEKTSWITCKMFGGMAEKLSQYITKGSKVTVSGEFVLEEWESNGVKNKMPCLMVSQIELPPKNGPQGSQQTSSWGNQQQSQQPRQSNQSQAFDDDIPW